MENPELMEQFELLQGDLRNAVGPDGTVVNTAYIAEDVAFHLVRAGWRRTGERKIKPRQVVTSPEIDAVVQWVPFDTPDTPPVDVKSLTIEQLANLPEKERAEAIRHLGGHIEPQGGWTAPPRLNVADSPDHEDGTEWN